MSSVSLAKNERLDGISPYALRRALAADGWLKRAYGVARTVHSDWVRMLVARVKNGGSGLPTDNDTAELEAELELKTGPVTFSMVEAGYEWAGQEFNGSGSAGAPDAEGKAEVAPTPVPSWEEFLQQADFSQVEEHIKAVSHVAARTQAGRISDVFQKAAAQHETVALVAGELLERGLVESQRRAALWARTETMWAYNEGAHQQYVAQGIPIEEWLVTPDDALCEFCAMMDGVKIRTADNFLPAGQRLDGADGGGLSSKFDVGHPPLHPNCRCVVVPGVL